MSEDTAVTNYWNHNTAFHDELVARAARIGGSMIDVGCGDGLLAWRLAAVATEVTAIDIDPAAVRRARERLDPLPNTRVIEGDMFTALGGAVFDVVTCVATLHHVPLRSGLARLHSLVAPGGVLLVIGLAANACPADWVLSGLQAIPVRIASRLHHEAKDIGVQMVQPRESLREIREAAARALPGVEIRRRFYFRYSLVWRRPG